MRFVAQVEVIPLDGVYKIIQLGHYFDPGKATTCDHKCQQLAEQFGVVLDVGFLENLEQVITQDYGVCESPKRHCVFDKARHAAQIGDVAECNNQIIIFELDWARPEPRADSYDLLFQVDVLNFPHNDICAWEGGEWVKPHWSNRSIPE